MILVVFFVYFVS